MYYTVIDNNDKFQYLKYYMFIDTHCHLDFKNFDSQRENIINECDALDIKHIINPATNFSNWHKLIQLQQNFKKIHICFGLHPIFIAKHTKHNLEQLELYTNKYNTKLIGEIGLDKRFDDFEQQQHFFQNQLSIAKNLNKKVIIHAVKSHNEIIKTLKDISFKNGGIIHAFNANTQMAKTYIDMGFSLGIGGQISYKKNKLAQTLKQISIRNIVLETDAPDMLLYKDESGFNKPQNIIHIFDILKNIYTENTDILKQQIYINSLEFI